MKIKHSSEVFELLEQKHAEYEHIDFIANDPILIPHRYQKKEDIEISGFLSAIIAWGQRSTIIKNASRMMEIMDDDPHAFITQHQASDLKSAEHFVHRTFNSIDFIYFLKALQDIYLNKGGLEKCFAHPDLGPGERISKFKEIFFSISHPSRTRKHLSDPLKKSSAKRLNMFLRWMVRPNDRGVDFGLWKSIKPSELMIPLDVHTGRIARDLGLLKRKQNDWQAVVELSEVLKTFDPEDPVKYDFALFGMGVYKDLA